MAEDRTGYKHDASDRKLDHSAEAAGESGQTHDTQHSSGAGHTSARQEPAADEDTANAEMGEQKS